MTAVGNFFRISIKRMCLGTFSRLARSLATIYIFARVCILDTLVPFYVTGNFLLHKKAEHMNSCILPVSFCFILSDSITDQISHLGGSDLLFALVHNINGAVALCENLSDRILDGICFLVKVEGEAGASSPRRESSQSDLQCLCLRYPVRSHGSARRDRICSHLSLRRTAFRWIR